MGHRALFRRALAGRLKGLPDTYLVSARSTHWKMNVSVAAPAGIDGSDFQYSVNPSAMDQKAVELMSGTLYPYADSYVSCTNTSEEGYPPPTLILKVEASQDLSTLKL